MEKILIIKTSSLGDIIHTYPAVEYLRKKFPHAQIDWVVETPFSELVRSHPGINNALCVSTKAWRRTLFQKNTLKGINAFRKQLRQNQYDVVFDLQGNLKSGLILSQVRSPQKVGFGKQSVAEWPNLLFTNRRLNPIGQGNIRQDYLSLVTSYFGDEIGNSAGNITLKITPEQSNILNHLLKLPTMQDGPKVVVCSGSAWRNKQMTAEALAQLLSLVQHEYNAKFFLVWGSQEEREVALQLFQKFPVHAYIVDKMNLTLLQNLMAKSDLVIAMDSLPLHLAGTTSTPTFSVFGASSAAKYKPLGPNHEAYQGTCPYNRTFVKRCPILRTCETGACIRSLSGEEVFASFRSWFKG